MFLNKTPYKGRLYLSVEEYPYYSKGNTDILSIVLFKVGKKYISVRLKKRGFNYKLLNKAMAYTNCTYRNENFKNKEILGDIAYVDLSYTEKNTENLEIFGVVDAQTLLWMYKNNLKAVEGCNPMSVVGIYNNADELIGYHGRSHRGGQSFHIGDKLFDSKYIPVQEDYYPWEWAGFEQKHEKSLQKWRSKGEEEFFRPSFRDTVPFNKRGKRICQDLEDCLKAAINISKYLG